MSEHLKHTIYSPSDCLSEKILFDYIDNKLSQKERHIVEKHLLDCEMCSDALEGLELTKDRNRIALIKEAINKRVLESTKKEAVVVSFNYKMAFSIAAAIALLVVGVFFFNQINLKEATMTGDMAELKKTESPAPPPAPPTGSIENIVTETAATGSGKETTETNDETAKVGPSKIVEQEIALADEEQKPGFYNYKEGVGENSIAPAESSGNGDVIAFDATITPQDDRKNNQLETVSIPKTSAPEREKDAKLDDTKKAEEKTIAGATGGTYAWSTPDQKQKNTADNNSANGEKIELAKKADKGEKYRSEGKLFEEKEKGKSKKAQVVTKESRADEDGNKVAGDVAYAPKSISQTTEKSKDVEELKSEVVTNTSTTSANQTYATTVTDSIEHVYTVVEQMPEYPGGNDSLMKFIRKNFNFYQTVDKSNIITTKIWVQFIVGKDGTVRDPKIVKGINPELDKEAIRVVKMMPKWKPGKQNGKAVSTTFNLPIQLEFK